MVKKIGVFLAFFLLIGQAGAQSPINDLHYDIPDTGQNDCLNKEGQAIPCTANIGQDAAYRTTPPAYEPHFDGTVTDVVTGLMWQKTLHEPVTWHEAFAEASALTVGNYTDWRVPTIKELYSLIQFAGRVPYLDKGHFDVTNEAVFWSSTQGQGITALGVDFSAGSLNAYPLRENGDEVRHYVRYVRGTSRYGLNLFEDKGDNTVTDAATGLMWLKGDSGAFGRETFNWLNAMAWCENLTYVGFDDWRLPNAKELQNLVDYSHPANTPSIHPVFEVSPITEGDNPYPVYWSSTRHNQQGVAFLLVDGTQSSIDVTESRHARCVRAGTYEVVVENGTVAQPTPQTPQNQGGQQPGQNQQGGQQPPQEAIDACVDLNESDPCVVNLPNGALDGTCRITPDEVLACIPARGQGPGGN